MNGINAIRLHIYPTDALLYFLVLLFILFLYSLKKNEVWREILGDVFSQPRYIVSILILLLFAIVGLLDSIHFQDTKNSYIIRSLLDLLLSPRDIQFEKTYSSPFAVNSHSQEGEFLSDILFRTFQGILIGLLIMTCLYGFLSKTIKNHLSLKSQFQSQIAFWVTLGFIVCIIAIISRLMFEYHIMGTNKVGQDVFYISLKSIRTGWIIGTLTTLFMLPFALLLGMCAGFFRGWVDDFIQYLYTTLSSIPGVLLIAAAVLSFQVRIQQNPELRLLLLCVILGVTSWSGLCRLLRGETLKLREAEYVEGARVLGVKPFKILKKHILPNLMHIVVISVVLDFSGLVLAEAVLSYVGVGVDPSTYSFGNMINAARLEMAREPVVWWALTSALILMFLLVFSANVVSDGIQRALNPRMN